jgi:hypothetical protein
VAGDIESKEMSALYQCDQTFREKNRPIASKNRPIGASVNTDSCPKKLLIQRWHFLGFILPNPVTLEAADICLPAAKFTDPIVGCLASTGSGY